MYCFKQRVYAEKICKQQNSLIQVIHSLVVVLVIIPYRVFVDVLSKHRTKHRHYQNYIVEYLSLLMVSVGRIYSAIFK